MPNLRISQHAEQVIVEVEPTRHELFETPWLTTLRDTLRQEAADRPDAALRVVLSVRPDAV